VSASAFVLVDAILPIGNHAISEYLRAEFASCPLALVSWWPDSPVLADPSLVSVVLQLSNQASERPAETVRRVHGALSKTPPP
jgi:hypothetical protein